MFKIEMNFTYGWDDAGWTETDPDSDKERPCRFLTREAAQAAIDEFIKDQHEAVDAGDMADKYDPEDYRVMEVK